MSLLDWIKSWFLGPAASPSTSHPASTTDPSRDGAATEVPSRKPRRRVRLTGFRYTRHGAGGQPLASPTVAEKPYRFARPSVMGGFLDLSGDGDNARLHSLGVPAFQTPEELAEWLKIPLGQLAWLVNRFDEHQRPEDLKKSHYHYQWKAKRAGGERLLEIPKPKLRAVQSRILREILDKVPAHASAHGFVKDKSIRTNAVPHVGKRVVVKFDLENFYPSVSFSRVVAIYRSLGYSREAASWLGRLTTSTLPRSIYDMPDKGKWGPYLVRHLPQGVSTSPALANLSAFALDLRLSGLARKFEARYTRYADDLTFSGSERFLKSLAVFLPLVQQIIRHEKFRVNLDKRRILRSNQRQSVAGVVVNEKPNVRRRDYDALKATLVNCIRLGPASQNHSAHPDFLNHLLGRIAHVKHLHPTRGLKLSQLFEQIDWNR